VNNNQINKKNSYGLAVNTIWSQSSYKQILEKISQGHYDIVHVQNFFPLFSPSIFYAAQKTKTKIVMSVRNYRLVCPNAMLYVNGEICKLCVGKKIPVHAITKKCYRKDVGASSVVVAMLSVHNFLNTWKNKIDGLICVSHFVKEQLLSAGFENDKLHTKYNFVCSDVLPNYEDGKYYIYAGRLSEEKGITEMLEAFKNSERRLVIVGDGPMREQVENCTKQNNNITWCGKRSLNEIYEMIADAKALIFPSKWHEPFGRTIIEAFAHGTPVIASALGGVKELVTDNYNGFLFDPYKKEDISRAIFEFENFKDRSGLRSNCYHSYVSNFTPSINYKQLISIYNKVLSS
jgi:glycosyltransferase involved in cell wall biosynthesis